MPTSSKSIRETVGLPDFERAFTWMVFVSLLVHTVVTAYLYYHRGNGSRLMTASYIDLNMSRPASALTAPSPANSSAEPEIQPVANKEAEATPPHPLSPYEQLASDMGKALESAPSHPEAFRNLSFGLGMTNGYFSSLSEGRTLRPDIREYYFELLRSINEKWWIGANNRPGWAQEAVINVTIARNGTVMAIDLIRSSGNQAWDRELVNSIRTASPLPPLPDRYTDDFFQAPLRFVAPLNLMFPSPVRTTEPAHSSSSSSNSSRS